MLQIVGVSWTCEDHRDLSQGGSSAVLPLPPPKSLTSAAEADAPTSRSRSPPGPARVMLGAQHADEGRPTAPLAPATKLFMRGTIFRCNYKRSGAVRFVELLIAACGVLRKLIAMRLQAFIKLIAIVRSTSSFSLKTVRAAWYASSGTPV